MTNFSIQPSPITAQTQTRQMIPGLLGQNQVVQNPAAQNNTVPNYNLNAVVIRRIALRCGLICKR